MDWNTSTVKRAQEVRKTRKSNEVLKLYAEVKNEIEEKEDLLEIICLKEKLSEKIGNNKDIYLRYLSCNFTRICYMADALCYERHKASTNL